MEYLIKTLLSDFSRSDLYVLLFIGLIWKVKALNKEIESLKNGANSLLTKFGETVSVLKKETTEIFKSAGEQIAKSFDRVEGHVKEMSIEVVKIKNESNKEDTKHDVDIKNLVKRTDRLEGRQDKLMENMRN